MNDHDIAESLKRIHSPAPPTKRQAILETLLGYAVTPVLYLWYFCFSYAWNGANAAESGSYAILIALTAALIGLIVCVIAGSKYSAVGRYNRSLFVGAGGILLLVMVLACVIGFYLA